MPKYNDLTKYKDFKPARELHQMKKRVEELAHKLSQMEKDLEDAAGELRLPIPEPGTDLAKLMSANILLRRENEDLRHKNETVSESSKVTETGWIEGFPTEEGDFWFYCVDAGYASLSRVKQGYARKLKDGHWIYVKDDFIYPTHYENNPRKRIWHRPLTLPDAPEFDRTCPSCQGKGKALFRECFDCRGTGSI